MKIKVCAIQGAYLLGPNKGQKGVNLVNVRISSSHELAVQIL